MSARSSDRERILLVGFGARGRQWARAVRRRRDVELVGVVDPDDAAHAAARQEGLPAWASLDEALQAGRPAAAIVSSPPWEHAEQATALLRLGLAVLVEKPVALSLADAAAVARESLAAGRPAVVGQNFRFLPRERAVRKALADGDVGRPLSATIVSARPPSAAAPHLTSVVWGPLWDICLHHFDALRIRFSRPPATVEARTRTFEASPGGDRLQFEVFLRWADGLSVTYQHSEGAPGFHHYEWIEGERRAIMVHDQKVSVCFPRHRPRRISAGRSPSPEQAVLQDFLRAMRDEAPSALGVAENLTTIAIVEAVARSLDLGREVSLAEISESAGASVLLESTRRV